MRTRLGMFVSLSTAMVLAVATFGGGAGAAADDPVPGDEPVTSVDESTTRDDESPTSTSTSTTTTSSTSTTTTTTSTTTTTTTIPPETITTTAAPDSGSASISRAADGGDGVSVTRAERLDAPGDAGKPAERNGEPLQLTEPPPTPTTTTLPPPNVLPPNSGEGRRIVYSKTNQWVWLIEADGTIVKDHQVSGSRVWNLPRVGTYQVSSKSMHTCALQNPSLCWRYMVRFARGPNATWRDNIGFHEIPIDTRHGGPVQGEWQLGEPLSGGCVRQTTPDAIFLWDWTPIGTTVVVLG